MFKKPKKAGKYRNEPTVVDGQRFDSSAEAGRYYSLVLMQRAGLISGLARQADFVLAPAVVINGKKKAALVYRADFKYTEVETGRQIVEDKKGALTPVYIIKRHLMKSVHGIDILET